MLIKIRNKLLRRQAGIGLLELMLSLAIIAILLIMATRYYLTTSRSEKVNDTISIVQALVAAGGDYLNAHGSLKGFSMTDVAKAGEVPQQYVDGSNVYSAWLCGTACVISDNGSDASTLSLTIGTPTTEDAQFLANRLAGSGSAAATNTSVNYSVVIGTGINA